MSTSTKTVNSCWLGGLSLLLAFVAFWVKGPSFLLVFLTAVPAVIQGVLALREIPRSAGQLSGRALAFAGIGTGLVGSCLGVGLVLQAVDNVRESQARMT